VEAHDGVDLLALSIGSQFSPGTPRGFFAAMWMAIPPPSSSFMPPFRPTLYFLRSLRMKKPFLPASSSMSAVIGSELGIISQRVAEEAPEAGQQCAVALHATGEREPEHGPLWSGLATHPQQAYMLDLPAIKRIVDLLRQREGPAQRACRHGVHPLASAAFSFACRRPCLP
jgi:hypothetical protein